MDVITFPWRNFHGEFMKIYVNRGGGGGQGIANLIQVTKHQFTDVLQLLQYW